jgi:hypothetical protein
MQTHGLFVTNKSCPRYLAAQLPFTHPAAAQVSMLQFEPENPGLHKHSPVAQSQYPFVQPLEHFSGQYSTLLIFG